ENVSLIKEINNLRRELKQCRTRIKDLEAALGLNRREGEHARELLHQVEHSQPNLMLERELNEAQRTLEAQQDLIRQLNERLVKAASINTLKTSQILGAASIIPKRTKNEEDVDQGEEANDILQQVSFLNSVGSADMAALNIQQASHNNQNSHTNSSSACQLPPLVEQPGHIVASLQTTTASSY
ncbi:unnamed protein product, partial [Protopolystoma xenopodis]